MTYNYAKGKIYTEFGKTVERIDKAVDDIDGSAGWVVKSVWCSFLDDLRAQYRAAVDMIIEIYIDLNCGPENWRELSQLRFELENSLIRYIEIKKSECNLNT